MLMDYKDLDILLEKYLNGQSSLEEERQLKVIFSKEDLPARYTSYKEIFSFTIKQARLAPDAGIEEGIQKKITPGISRKRWMRGIAASVLIILLSGAVYFSSSWAENKTYASVKEVENPEEAYC